MAITPTIITPDITPLIKHLSSSRRLQLSITAPPTDMEPTAARIMGATDTGLPTETTAGTITTITIANTAGERAEYLVATIYAESSCRHAACKLSQTRSLPQ